MLLLLLLLGPIYYILEVWFKNITLKQRQSSFAKERSKYHSELTFTIREPSSDLFLPGEYESDEEVFSEATLGEGFSAH